MNKLTRITSLLVAALLLSTVGVRLEAAVIVAENQVEWAAASGDDISHVRPDVTANFFIRDDALETTLAARGTWAGLTGGVGAAGHIFNLATGSVGPAGAPIAQPAYSLISSAYNTTSPADTPLNEAPTVNIGTSQANVATTNLDVGIFALFAPVSAAATVIADFSHHVRDVYHQSDATLRRAKVFSTSDIQGEWVTITEVDSVTNPVPSATSRLFRGEVALDSDAGAAGAGDGRVWMQDGDNLTVNYYNAAGIVLDSDTLSVDAIAPSIVNVVPADGTASRWSGSTVRKTNHKGTVAVSMRQSRQPNPSQMRWAASSPWTR